MTARKGTRHVAKTAIKDNNARNVARAKAAWEERKDMPEPEPAKPAEPSLATVTAELIRISDSLASIAKHLERLVPPRRQTLDELDPPAPGHLIGPSTEPGGAEEFISGRWHRRAGDVYARVAEPGSPNAGEASDDGKAS